jgi:hypothetical protein
VDVQWRKSSKSAQAGNCVEVAELPGSLIGVRDSKDIRPERPVLTCSRTSWDDFLAAAQAGRFDLTD